MFPGRQGAADDSHFWRHALFVKRGIKHNKLRLICCWGFLSVHSKFRLVHERSFLFSLQGLYPVKTTVTHIFLNSHRDKLPPGPCPSPSCLSHKPSCPQILGEGERLSVPDSWVWLQAFSVTQTKTNTEVYANPHIHKHVTRG